MIVYKFGGASIKSASGIQQLAKIVKQNNENLVVVVSAMDKMTNALEDLVGAYFNFEKDCNFKREQILKFHSSICTNLFGQRFEDSFIELMKLYENFTSCFEEKPSLNYDFEYDKIVAFGELFSTLIISNFLNSINIDNEWIDIRKLLLTDSNYMKANIDFKKSEGKIKEKLQFKSENDTKRKIYITQGFIASDENNNNTTLGREGSDYTAALLAYFLDAEHVVVWKDVPGIMNADPSWLSDVEKIDELSYQEAIELAYYGAKLIHPKTIKPLQNKKIDLFVKSFFDVNEEGTKITEDSTVELKPIFIQKTNQVLLSILSTDFSFIIEENLSRIFALFAKYNINVNLTQNSAISFSVCFDNTYKLEKLVADLQSEYKVLYNEGMELITIRHYNQDAVDRIIGKRAIILEQKSRNTAQFVV